MKKPKAKSVSVFDFLEMQKYIEETYGIELRDFAGSHGKNDPFKKWATSKGYVGKTDPDGKSLTSSQIWYAEYRKDVEAGIVQEVPYQDFWHFLLDYWGYSISNGCDKTMCFPEILDFCKEDWQREITNFFIQEFGTEPIEVHIWW